MSQTASFLRRVFGNVPEQPILGGRATSPDRFGRGRAAVRRLWVYIENLILTGKFYRVCPGEEQGYFSFGACMFVGALAAFWKLSGR